MFLKRRMSFKSDNIFKMIWSNWLGISKSINGKKKFYVLLIIYKFESPFSIIICIFYYKKKIFYAAFWSRVWIGNR